MSAANPLLVGQTAVNAAFPVGGFNATEFDQFVLCTSNVALAGAEVVNIYVLDSKGGQQPLVNPITGSPYQLTAAIQAMPLPGGYLYQFGKSATVGAVGVDYLSKPRGAFAA